eukprot:157869-Pyramimonas_sp.AAC.1
MVATLGQHRPGSVQRPEDDANAGVLPAADGASPANNRPNNPLASTPLLVPCSSTATFGHSSAAGALHRCPESPPQSATASTRTWPGPM